MSEAIVTDKTLTIEDAPADAKAAGDAINNLRGAVGSPLVAAAAAAMTDTNKVYVYTGSETGYTNGNWYYHDGTSWVSGGVYNSIAMNIDSLPTLGSSNPVTSAGIKAALDSVDTEIGELKENFESLRPVKTTGKNILVTQPTRGFSFTFDRDKATFCRAGQPYAYSFEGIENATTWRTILNVWDLNGNKIVETDSATGAQNAFSVVSSRFFASGIDYNDIYYTETGNGTYKRFIFTFNQDCYVMFGFYFGDTSDTSTIINAQLEEGNAVTPYEPYSPITRLEDVINIDDTLDNICSEVYGEEVSTTKQTGKYIPNTGAITDISSTNYVVISATVTEGEKYRVIGQAYRNSYYYAFYDSNNTFISGSLATETGTTSIDAVVVAPTGAVLLAVCASTINPHILTSNGYGVTNLFKWNDKIWTAVGDSLTEVNDKTSKNYCDYISEDTGIIVNNMGVSGSGYMRKHNTSQSFYNRITKVPINSDVVTIFGSLNDLGDGQQLGTIDDTVSDGTVFGYVNGTLDALYTAFPSVNIGIISPTPWKSSEPWNADNNFTKYCEGLKQICYNRGIPFLDLYHCSNLRPWDATARDLFYSHDVVDGVNAGCHPDEAGHKMFAPKVKNFLESLLM